MAEKTVVAERDDIGSSEGHACGGFAGGADKEEILGKPSKSYREKILKRVRETGEMHVGGEPHGIEVLAGYLCK